MPLKPHHRQQMTATVLFVALGLSGCHRNQTQIDEAHPPGVTLTLLHTNDIHASVSARPSEHDGSGPLIGGFLALDAAVDGLRASLGADQTLLLDAGDLSTGGPASTLEWNGVPGGALFELMNTVGYDVWTLGNHEFDGERPQLGQKVAGLQFPTVSANLKLASGGAVFEQVLDHSIVHRAGLNIGIAGLMTEDLAGVLAAAKADGLVVSSAVEAARREVEALDAQTDLIIFITHMGVDADRALAEAVPGIDVIIGGHSHTRLDTPVVVGQTLIVQTGSHLTHLGQLTLQVADDRVVDHSYALLPLLEQDGASDDTVALMAALTARIDAEFGGVLARLETAWVGHYKQESNVGDWLCDALVAHTGADVAMLNSGGIRTDLPEGDLTRADMLAVLPFDNRVATFEISGAGLRDIALHNATIQAGQAHGVLQVGGMRYTWRRQGDTVALSSLTVGGQPVDPARTYTVATIDYVLFDQADKYLGLVPEVTTRTDELLSAAMVEAATQAGSIRAALDGRMAEEAK